MKNFWLFFLIFLVFIGVNSQFLNSQSQVKEVTFDEFSKVIQSSEDIIHATQNKNSGEIEFTSGDTTYITKIPSNSQLLDPLVEENKLLVDSKDSVNWGTYIFYGLLIAFFIWMLTSQSRAQKRLQSPDKNGFKKEIPKTTLAEVGGLRKEVRDEIHQAVQIFQNKNEAKVLGVKPSNLLLYGPPGTGKTLIAKAFANALGANFYALSGSDFVEMFVGVGASRVRSLFADARKNRPSVIFIDEIDAIAQRRGRTSSNDERESTLNQLLVELDGVENNDDIIVITTTNRPDLLDTAFTRPGRFDSKILIPLPDKIGRKEIINIHIQSKKISKDALERLDDIAANTSGYSGADLENLFEHAAKRALLDKRSEIVMSDIDYAIDRTILGHEGQTLTDVNTKKRVAFHEAGHAVVSALVNRGNIRKATIIPRGEALGFVAHIPEELKLSTRDQLIGEIEICLAGGVAEKIIFGQHSIGVGGDVQQANRIIERMVELGMSTEEFVLNFDEKTKKSSMDSIYKEAYERCIKRLTENMSKLDLVANALLDKETIDGHEIEELIYGSVLNQETIQETHKTEDNIEE